MLLPRSAVVAAWVLAMSAPSIARVIVAAPDGSPTAPGTAEVPLSLHAAAESLKPGDTLLLRGGTYRLDRPLRLTVRGTADAPVLIAPESDTPVILDASAITPTPPLDAPSPPAGVASSAASPAPGPVPSATRPTPATPGASSPASVPTPRRDGTTLPAPHAAPPAATSPATAPARRRIDLTLYNAVTLDNAAHLTLKGLTATGSRYVNVYVTGVESSHLALDGLTSTGSYGPGICLHRGQHLRVLRCTVTGANDQGLRPPGMPLRNEAPHEALSLMQIKHFEIAYNRVHKCHKEGIDIKETASHGSVHHNETYDLPRQGIYLDCWFGHLTDVDVYANVSHDNEWGIAISAEGQGASMSNIRIRHNVVYRNRASGIFFGLWGHDGPRKDIWITNNTIVGNGLSAITQGPGRHWAGNVGGIDLRASNLQSVTVANNLVLHNGAFDLAAFTDDPSQLAARGIRIVNNLTSPFPATLPPEAGGMFPPPRPVRSEWTTPLDLKALFVLPNAADFRLPPDSPARDKADPTVNAPGSPPSPHLGAIQE